MATGFPTKSNWSAGDVLTAAQMDDLAGTVNLLNPTTKGNLITASAANTVALQTVGSNGQVLTADSTQTTGMKWATPSSSPLTTKGDVYGFDTAGARIPIGTNGQVLTADSTQTLGLKWATATGSTANLSTLASGTLSGTSLTLSSLTSDFMQFIVVGATWNTASEQPVIFLNNSTTSASYKNVFYDGSASTFSGYYYNGSNPGVYLNNSTQIYNNSTKNILKARK
jgi:hypothetical protein